jgi:epoxyqueuosine reductase
VPEPAPILQLCRSLGFANAGVATLEPSRWSRELIAWLEAGKHGSMSWLERNLETRLDPARLLPGAKCAIMVADLYTDRNNSIDPPLEPCHGRIARYARGRDYHTVLKKRLHTLADRLREGHPGHDFRAFTDTAPILERELAHRAGLGWIGKHTLLIHPRLGSYFFLGGLLTTLDLATPTTPEPDHCGTCTRCIDACPTQAITPYSVDASRCISYLTIEHRAEVPSEFHAPIDDNLFGCDICQEVCPHNSPRVIGSRGIGVPADAPAASADSTVASARVPPPASAGTPMPRPNPSYTPRHSSLPLLNILSWTPADRSSTFQASALKRATLTMMKRNAIIAAGNLLRHQASPPLVNRLRSLADDPAEDDLVRTAARDVLRGIASPSAPDLP